MCISLFQLIINQSKSKWPVLYPLLLHKTFLDTVPITCVNGLYSTPCSLHIVQCPAYLILHPSNKHHTTYTSKQSVLPSIISYLSISLFVIDFLSATLALSGSANLSINQYVDYELKMNTYWYEIEKNIIFFEINKQKIWLSSN